MSKKTHDLIIIGAGPAGLTASIYASRYGVDHLVVGSVLGGQISETHEIDNYPGMENMNGFEFSQKWGHHVEKYGIGLITKRVKQIKKAEKSQNFEITIEDEDVYNSRTVLLATGAKRRKLHILGEDKFIGKGVSYCATCDGFFYRGKTVAVIGGSDSATTAAIYLAGISQKVFLVYRKSNLRCEPYWEKIIKETKNIEVIFETNVLEVVGKEKIEKVILDKEYGVQKELKIDGLFIEAGSDPDISYALDLGVALDGGGYVKIGKDSSTSVPGVWAAGDLTDGSDKFRQVITAASEGAIAARSIFNWLKKFN
jgi:thioredoxin reductase (NADPH)